MPTEIHFMNVGQGNMTLLKLSNGKNFLYDCNVTEDREDEILRYLHSQLGVSRKIDTFICSHRDSDHMRGVKKIHARFPIQHVWDSGAVGTTPDCTEYLEYMDLRRRVTFTEVKPRTRYDYGNTRLRVMNAKNDDLASNANAQSIVLKVVHRNTATDTDITSALLTGDTDAQTWQNIHQHYGDGDLSCEILLASHHGALTYFDDPTDTKNYYTKHILAKKPAMTIISVGENSYGHPDPKSLQFYEEYSRGSKQGNKIFRTDEKGNIRLILKDEGGWSLTPGV